MFFDKIRNSIPCENSVWLMYSAEGNDPFFKKFITKKTIVPAVSLISKNKIVIIAHSLDYDNLEDFYGEKIIYEKSHPICEQIEKVLKDMKFPENIYLNYSEGADVSTDILGYGTYKFLSKNIEEVYNKNMKKVNFLSAEPIIFNLLESKTEEDIKYMKLSAGRALQIIENVFKKIKIGMSEKDIFNLFHEEFKIKPAYFKDHGIVDEEFSWEEDGCPIVLVGPNLLKGGHAMPSCTELKEGYTIYCDFGVKLCLKNGQKYASDLQRMGYALLPGEKTAPISVKKVFNTLVEAISLGIKNCTPYKKGYEIDSMVRNYILSKGYPNYNHSTGHPVGEEAHSFGACIAPNGSKKSELLLKNNGVYTIEPRIQIENGGSIEEMVLVTKSGGVTLCARQKELYYIT